MEDDEEDDDEFGYEDGGGNGDGDGGGKVDAQMNGLSLQQGRGGDGYTTTTTNNNNDDGVSLRHFLHTVASVLAAAAEARRVPRKWGGVFGQEWGWVSMTSASARAGSRAGTRVGYAETQELGIDMIGGKVGGLTLTSATPTTAAPTIPSLPPLPITLIGGCLGSGKTSLVKHLVASLTQRQLCKHVAVVVNTTAEINPGKVQG